MTDSAREELAYLPAMQLIEMLNRRDISSAELTASSIARIEALDGEINAVVVRDFDRAMAKAIAADGALARAETLPLLGLPITIKESFSIEGLPTTWGDPGLGKWMPPASSLCVERLENAGAIILGKTNVPFMLGDLQSYNALYGTTNNPWDLERTAGGSSGGSAAALAAGFVSLELGSDLAGSLRIPAHFCGVFAHRPSLELIPMRGSGPPMAPHRPDRGEFAVPGPMARSVADLELGLDVMAGPDPLSDGIGYRLSLPPARRSRLRDYRVLLLNDHPLFPSSRAVQAAFDEFAIKLSLEGCRVDRASKLLPALADIAHSYLCLLGAFLSEAMPAAMLAPTRAYLSSIDPGLKSLALSYVRAGVMPHRDWLAARRQRSQLAADWRDLMCEYDVVVCPVTSTAAFKHDPHLTFLQDYTPDRQHSIVDVDGLPQNYDEQIVWTAIAPLLGIPATALPIGKSFEGLPIGAQVMGGFLEDRTTLGFAGLVEKAFGGFHIPRRRGSV